MLRISHKMNVYVNFIEKENKGDELERPSVNCET